MSVAMSMQNPVENRPVLHKVLNLAAKTRCILCCITKRKKYIGSVRASDNSMCVIIVTFLWMVSSQSRYRHLSHALSGCSCGVCHVCYHNVSVNKQNIWFQDCSQTSNQGRNDKVTLPASNSVRHVY